MKVFATLLLLATFAFAQDSSIRKLPGGFETKTRPYDGGAAILVKFPAKYVATPEAFIVGLKIALRRAVKCNRPQLRSSGDITNALSIVKCANGHEYVIYPMFSTSESGDLVGAAFTDYVPKIPNKVGS